MRKLQTSISIDSNFLSIDLVFEQRKCLNIDKKTSFMLEKGEYLCPF